MSSAHLVALEAKHALLERRIAVETGRPRPDALIIAQLKKEKLRVKEAMTAH